MTSIFALKTDVEDLESSNHGILSTNLRQVPCSRGVDKNSFSSGIQNYKFEMSGNKWWKPSESYMRIRCKLTKGDGTTPLTLSDDVAPSMNLGSQLWQNMDFKMGDTTVSRIANNVSQVSALKNRLDRSRSWSKSVGQSINFTDEEFYARQNAVSSDGVNDDYELKETLRLVEANYSVTDAVTYNAAANRAVIIYTLAQSPELWLEGDLYSDFTTPVNIPTRQIIGNVTASPDLKTWTLDLTTVVADAASSVVNLWSKTRAAGSDARRVSEMEIIYRPPLAIFDYETCLPCGKYELSLLPFSDAQLQFMAIESIGNTTKSPAAYKFVVDEVFLFVAEYEGENCGNMSYLLDLEQIRMQETTFPSNTFSQKAFDVSPSTTGLTIAYQDGRVNNDTRISASKFRVYPDAIPFYSATDVTNDWALSLNRQYMSYGGRNYPPEDAQTEFKVGVDTTVQRYTESLINSRGFYDTGGNESIQEFHSAGSYYHKKIFKAKGDQSTRAVVYSGFANAAVSNARALLFDTHNIIARVTLYNGAIQRVEVDDL